MGEAPYVGAICGIKRAMRKHRHFAPAFRQPLLFRRRRNENVAAGRRFAGRDRGTLPAALLRYTDPCLFTVRRDRPASFWHPFWVNRGKIDLYVGDGS